MYEFIYRNTRAKVVVSVIAFFTLCGFAYGIWVFFTGYTWEYYQYRQRAQELSGKVVVAVNCDNGYVWQVQYSAQAEPANFEMGPAKLRVEKDLVLLDQSAYVVSQSGHGESAFIIGSSLETLKPFEDAFVSTEVVEQMKAWSRPGYHSVMGPRRWSFFLVEPAKISENDFRSVAQCFADSYRILNDAFVANVPEYQSSQIDNNVSLGGIYRMNPWKKFSETTFICVSGTKVRARGETLSLVKEESLKEVNVVGVAGLDGVIRPSVPEVYLQIQGRASYHTLPTDKVQLNYFHDLERIVKEEDCSNGEEKLWDTIKSIPQKVKVFEV